MALYPDVLEVEHNAKNPWRVWASLTGVLLVADICWSSLLGNAEIVAPRSRLGTAVSAGITVGAWLCTTEILRHERILPLACRLLRLWGVALFCTWPAVALVGLVFAGAMAGVVWLEVFVPAAEIGLSLIYAICCARLAVRVDRSLRRPQFTA